MSQEIQTVGERAKAICGAEAETQKQHIDRLESSVRLRLCCAYQILFSAITPAGTTEVVGDVCVGVEFLCTDALRELNELEHLGRFERVAEFNDLEDVRLFLASAIDILKLATLDDCLGINAVFGVTRILSTAEDSLEKALCKKESSEKKQTNTVLQ